MVDEEVVVAVDGMVVVVVLVVVVVRVLEEASVDVGRDHVGTYATEPNRGANNYLSGRCWALHSLPNSLASIPLSSTSFFLLAGGVYLCSSWSPRSSTPRIAHIPPAQHPRYHC